jgi:chemotaxis protein methyltransferase CheR
VGARDPIDPLRLPAAGGPREVDFDDADFARVRRLIHARAGIHLNESKANMVHGRLARRLRATGIGSFRGYLDRLEHDPSFARTEQQEFVNALTTNVTAFFREPHHFPMLAEFARAHRSAGPLRIWSAACATGEEPYSIAITLDEALGPDSGSRVLATDIDTAVLGVAARGQYPLAAVQGCGPARLKRYFLRGRGAQQGMVRVRPEIAQRVDFAPLNLLDPQWPALRAFAPGLDAVFCRNVLIYFDRDTRRRVLARIAQVLAPNGLLFVGHSESLTDCRAFALRGRTVYQRL